MSRMPAWKLGLSVIDLSNRRIEQAPREVGVLSGRSLAQLIRWTLGSGRFPTRTMRVAVWGRRYPFNGDSFADTVEGEDDHALFGPNIEGMRKKKGDVQGWRSGGQIKLQGLAHPDQAIAALVEIGERAVPRPGRGWWRSGGSPMIKILTGIGGPKIQPSHSRLSGGEQPRRTLGEVDAKSKMMAAT